MPGLHLKISRLRKKDQHIQLPAELLGSGINKGDFQDRRQTALQRSLNFPED